LFNKPFSFKGRIRRTEYGISLIIFFFGAQLLVILNQHLHPILGILVFPLYWFLFAQGAKREHDVGFSGWWQLFPLRIIWLIFLKGEIGENKYGPSPNN